MEEEFRMMLLTSVKEFAANEGTWNLATLLGTLLFGAATDQLVTVPMTRDQDGELCPAALVTRSGDRYAGLLTKTDEREPIFADVPLRLVFEAVCSKEDNLAGLVIDPHGDDIRIPTVFFSGAQLLFQAGQKDALTAEEETSNPAAEEDDDELEFVLEVSCSVPLTEKESARLEEIVHTLGEGQRKEAVLNVNGGSSDDLEYIRLIRENAEDGYYMELSMNMTDYEWEEPLVLSCGNMTEKQTMTVLRELCVEQKEANKVEFVWNQFRQK